MAAKSNQKPDGDWTIAGTKVRLSRPPTPLSRNPRDQLAILMRSRTAVCASRRHLRTTLARRHNVSAWEAEAERARPHVADIASFEAELLSLLRPAYRLALGMTLDPALAEDVVQEAAFRAWERQAQRRPGTDLRPWLFAIVANHCRDLKRRPWARVVRLDASVEAPAAGTDVHRDLAVRRALLALPANKRLAVVLRYYLELPYDDVARTLGCSVNAAKLRVGRAAVELRSWLVDEGLQ